MADQQQQAPQDDGKGGGGKACESTVVEETGYIDWPVETELAKAPEGELTVPEGAFTVPPPEVKGAQNSWYALHPLSSHETNSYEKLPATIVKPYSENIETHIETGYSPKTKCILVHTPDSNIQSQPLRSTFKIENMSRALPGLCNECAALFFGITNASYNHISGLVNYLQTTMQGKEMKCKPMVDYGFEYPAIAAYNPYNKFIKDDAVMFTPRTILFPSVEMLGGVIQLLAKHKPDTPIDFILNLFRSDTTIVVNPVLVLSLWQIISLIMSQSMPVLTSENLTDRDIEHIAAKSAFNAPCGSNIVTLYIQLVCYICMMTSNTKKLPLGTEGGKSVTAIPKNFEVWVKNLLAIKLGHVSIISDSSIDYQIQIAAARMGRCRLLIENTIPLPGNSFKCFYYPGLIALFNAALPGKIAVPPTNIDETTGKPKDDKEEEKKTEDESTVSPPSEDKLKYWPTEAVNIQQEANGAITVSSLCHGNLFVSPICRLMTTKLLSWLQSQMKYSDGTGVNVRSMMADMAGVTDIKTAGPISSDARRGFRELAFESRYIQVKQFGGGFNKIKKSAGYIFPNKIKEEEAKKAAAAGEGGDTGAGGNNRGRTRSPSPAGGKRAKTS